ncbi:hypothetical protein GOP47_0003505 [Adiantum capillus-veneris]|nr:hypothetical protein GOP47_0003505 [Adiantum capillus-veneris]
MATITTTSLATAAAVCREPSSIAMKASLRAPDFSSLHFTPQILQRKLSLSTPSLVMARTASQRGTAERNIYEQDAKVIQVHTVKEFDAALEAAKNKLVVVEYAASHSPNSRKIYPSMVELSLACQDAVFILVMGDESGETKELCERAGIDKVPHFIFYKNKEIVHEEEGIGPDELLGDVLYYGDPDAPILQLHSKEELQGLIKQHKEDGKLLVVDVGLKHCGPCVKVYPTFVKLAKKMRETAVFARIHGDENEELMGLLKQMEVVEVPTFLFFTGGELRGRYVGSGKGELVGEILRYQGVRVTY